MKKTHLFIDEPAETDEFGTHSRIATLIHEEIAASAVGHSIALVGDWGSGKSTVIRLLQKTAEKHKVDGTSSVTAEIFIYDAWAHQGDPLRRSFLDDLNAYSRKNNLRTEEEELGVTQRLWNRVEQTVTTTEPIVQRHAKVLIASALLVPIGVKLLQFPTDLTADALLTFRNFFAAALALTPAVVAAFYLVIFRSRSTWLRDFAFGSAWKSEHFSVTSFLVEKVQGRAERKTIHVQDAGE